MFYLHDDMVIEMESNTLRNTDTKYQMLTLIFQLYSCTIHDIYFKMFSSKVQNCGNLTNKNQGMQISKIDTLNTINCYKYII